MTLYCGLSDTVKIIMKQRNPDYDIRTNDGETLAQRTFKNGYVKTVETTAVDTLYLTTL